MTDDLRRRVDAVERAVTGGEPIPDVGDAATLDARLADVEARLDELSTRVDDLDATTQALRGYLGGVDGLSADVERRADLALAKAEALEAAVFDGHDDDLVVERLCPATPPTTADANTAAADTDAAPDSSSPARAPPRDGTEDTAPESTVLGRLRDVL